MKNNCTNLRIKVALMEHSMNQYELAKAMNIHEASLSRKLREELPCDEQDRIVALICQSKGGSQDDHPSR